MKYGLVRHRRGSIAFGNNNNNKKEKNNKDRENGNLADIPYRARVRALRRFGKHAGDGQQFGFQTREFGVEAVVSFVYIFNSVGHRPLISDL